mgnify:CR=1 FL=1
MAGLDRDTPVPSDIKLHRVSKLLELHYPGGEHFSLPCEYLRVFTPSAEAKGHGVGQEILQVGKRDVTIDAIEAVGNYALKFIFSDGHDTGLYSWDLLYNLGKHHEELWQEYLKRLELASLSRDPTANPAAAPKAGACDHHH